MSDDIGAEKLAALEALLLKEREKRASEEPISVIVTGVPDADDEDAVCVTMPPKPPEDRAPSVEDFGGRRRASEAMAAARNPPPSTPAPRPQQSVETPDSGPHRIIVQTRAPDSERGDHGQVEEAVYVVRDGVLHVDDGERELGSQRLQPGDDPRSVARSILREKKAPNDFWGRTLH